MKKLITSLLGLAMAFLLSSCLEFETEITVNKDGSGTIEETLLLGEQASAMMAMAAQQGGEQSNPLTDMKDEAKAKTKASTFGEGVTFVKSEEIKVGDKTGVKNTYKFTDINKVTFNPSSTMDDMEKMQPKRGGDAEKKPAANGKKATFSYADGTLVVTLPQPKEDKDAAKEAGDDAGDFDPNDPQLAMVKQMIQGMRMSMKVSASPGIAETDASHHKGNTVTMLSVDFGKMLEDPKGMKIMNSMKDASREEVAKMMKNVKGVEIETKETVTIKIK